VYKSFFIYTRLVCICAVISLLASCKNEISEIRALTDVTNMPVQTSYNAEYSFTEKGKLKNKLIATQIDQYEGNSDYIEASNGFTMIFFDSLQQEEARLTAMRGIYNSTEKKLIAREKVELYNKKGERLETEELIFLQDSAKIFTDKYLTISLANGSVLHGKGLVSNDSFTKYRILKPSGELYLDDK
jgi:LPS export ABC transporter protein LptC